MEVIITAIGTALPQYSRSQLDTASLISAGFKLKPAEKRLLNSIYKSTGIHYRHSVLSDYCRLPGEFEFFPNDSESDFPSTSARMQLFKDNALTLALIAIKNCLSSLSNFDVKSITHVITISCTGMYAPGLDIEIVQQLKLNSNTKRTAINFMGCYGAFNGLKIANSICHAEPDAKVLMVCVELCTIHFQKKMTTENMISNAIFSDGAAAVIVQRKSKLDKYLLLSGFHCDLIEHSGQEMAWKIADNGFDIILSSYVPQIIQTGIHDFTQKLLNAYHLSQDDISFYAIHPGGLKILQACEQALSITEHDNRYSYAVLQQFGNMSSATVLFVLKEIWNDLTFQRCDKTILSCAFGPGLTLESMLLQTYCA